MNIPCQLVLKDCLPCNDDPIRNISAEAPDVDVFIAFRDFRGNPPLGVVFAQIGCKAICFSATSQQDADDCALRQAQECVWGGWHPPVFPPIPPGPNGPLVPNTPGGTPPSHPRNRIPLFYNTAQTCSIPCPDGSIGDNEIVRAGTVVALSQAEADEKAKSLACIRSAQHQICFLTPADLPGACVGSDYSLQLLASGGEGELIWGIESGSLPNGLSLDGDGLLSGSPTASGTFSFTLLVVDNVTLQIATKDFNLCVMDIVTAATLPNGKPGDVYSQPLVQQPGTVSSEQWSLIKGTLPVGITLLSTGVLQGTPTTLLKSTFTLQVTATCDGVPLTCQKEFTLDVTACGTAPSTFFDFPWLNSGQPGGTFTMTHADGTFSATPTPVPHAESIADAACNPKADPYAFTAQFNWTGAGFTIGVANSTRVILKVAGVDVDTSPAFNANGSFAHTLNGMLPSGTSQVTVRIISTAGGAGVINGTCNVRPLTPP